MNATHTSRHIAIVGAGIGGLCTAIRLAAAGHTVDLFEKNAAAGGKLFSYTEAGFHFDVGPSTLTMPWVFEELATLVGESPAKWFPYQQVPINHRNVFADGTVLDSTTDLHAMQQGIAAYSSRDAARFPAYLAEAKRIYDHSVQHFFSRSFAEWRDFLSPALLGAFLAVRPLQAMAAFHRRFFQDPRTLMMLDRYATYVGSSPYQAPATLAMIAHLEYGTGVWYLPGGTSTLIRSLTGLAEQVGVRLHLNAPVAQLLVDDRTVRGLHVHGERLAFDRVVVNADLLAAHQQLLPERDRPHLTDARIAAREPSLSGFVLLLGLDRQYETLEHHTLFFPARYELEFTSLFRTHQPIEDPAIYICTNSITDPTTAPPGGSNLFVLVNAPSLHPANAEVDWAAYSEHILDLLATRCGLTNIRDHIVVRRMFTPHDLQAHTNAHRGAIYGLSSNSFTSAFFRPPMRSPQLRNALFVGGSTHPGGGTPMVALGAKIAAGLIERS